MLSFTLSGKKLDDTDPNILPTYARQFGLGQLTGIQGVAESAGVVPDPQWKRDNVNDGWSTGDAINLSIGQGFLLVTPLQMANIYNSIANGGTIWQPRLVVAHPQCRWLGCEGLPPCPERQDPDIAAEHRRDAAGPGASDHDADGDRDERIHWFQPACCGQDRHRRASEGPAFVVRVVLPGSGATNCRRCDGRSRWRGEFKRRADHPIDLCQIRNDTEVRRCNPVHRRIGRSTLE